MLKKTFNESYSKEKLDSTSMIDLFKIVEKSRSANHAAELLNSLKLAMIDRTLLMDTLTILFQHETYRDPYQYFSEFNLDKVKERWKNMNVAEALKQVEEVEFSPIEKLSDKVFLPKVTTPIRPNIDLQLFMQSFMQNKFSQDTDINDINGLEDNMKEDCLLTLEGDIYNGPIPSVQVQLTDDNHILEKHSFKFRDRNGNLYSENDIKNHQSNLHKISGETEIEFLNSPGRFITVSTLENFLKSKDHENLTEKEEEKEARKKRRKTDVTHENIHFPLQTSPQLFSFFNLSEVHETQPTLEEELENTAETINETQKSPKSAN